MEAIHQYICNHIQLILGITDAHGVVVIAYLVMTAIVFAISIVAYLVFRLGIVPLIQRSCKQTRSIYLHVVAKNKTMDALSHFVSASILYAGIGLIQQQRRTDFFSKVQLLIHYISVFYVFLSLMFIISYLIWSLNQYYIKKVHFSNQYPINNYIKVVLVVVWSIWVLLMAAYFANTSPLGVLTGLGAVSTIFILLFRHFLLGIVASIQVTASNIMRIGDYIILDKHGVDGTVTDIAITTVTVLNCDNTIVTIPTDSLISEVVKNWRGVDESGGRRIKRSIYLDIESIMICDPGLLKNLSKIKILKDYIDKHTDEEIINLALFRIYLLDYLSNSDDINQTFASIVCHRDSGVTGLPLEIYTFTKDTSLAGYENVQSKIFEHCFAALGIFKLKVLQYPTA